jgi:hypothetical protein
MENLIKKSIAISLSSLVLFSNSINSAELVFHFNSPSFSGIGYSSHVLTIYNMELSRKMAIAAENKAAALKAENDAKNTPMAKFISNLESRVYNELARQITEKLFEGQGTQVSGSFSFNGGTIRYETVGDEIRMTITDATGSVTTVTVPVGNFGWLPQ